MTRGRPHGLGRLARRNAQWVLYYSDATGRRRQKALGADKRVAERRRLEIIRRRDMELDGLGPAEGQNLELEEVAEQYLEDLTARVSSGHEKNIRLRLARTLLELDGLRIRDLRPMHLIRLRNEALAAGRSNRTANLIVETVKSMLKWAVETGLIAASPVQNVKKLPEGRGHQVCNRRAMNDDEIKRFLEAVRADDQRAALLLEGKSQARVPQEPFWVAILDTGARYGELRQATWGDISQREGLLVLRAENTKSRKARVIPLTERLRAALKKLQVAQQELLGRLPQVTDHVFLSPTGSPWGRYTTNPMRIFDRVLERAGIPRVDARGQKLDIHAMRHTFATRLARKNVGIPQAQQLLGHSDPKLTASIYTHLDADDLRGAIAALDAEGPSQRRTAGGER